MAWSYTPDPKNPLTDDQIAELVAQFNALAARVEALEDERREREEAEERAAEFEDSCAEYRARRQAHAERLAQQERQALENRLWDLERRR